MWIPWVYFGVALVVWFSRLVAYNLKDIKKNKKPDVLDNIGVSFMECLMWPVLVPAMLLWTCSVAVAEKINKTYTKQEGKVREL